MFEMSKRVFVTGATGFIGRRLVEQLCHDGAEVVALVRRKEHGLPDNVQPVYGDILDFDSFKTAGDGCGRLYHLAAEISFDPKKRAQLIRVNGDGTANILKAAKIWRVQRSVIVSSACTIGLSGGKDSILDEDALPTAEVVDANPYLASKLAAEEAALKASPEQPVVIVNPSTVYGPGDWSLNSGTLVMKVAKLFLLPVPSGGGNVVDVDDVVNGILAAGEYGVTGKRYILGNENLSFSQIFSTVAEVTKHRPLLIPIPKLMCGPMATAAGVVGTLTGSRFITPQVIKDTFAFKYYSNQRARHDLKWEPRYSLKESVQRAWDFYIKEGLV